LTFILAARPLDPLVASASLLGGALMVSLTESRPTSGEERSMVAPEERVAVFRRGRVLALVSGRALAAVRSLFERKRRPDMVAATQVVME
jgi:hypothetical protein